MNLWQLLPAQSHPWSELSAPWLVAGTLGYQQCAWSTWSAEVVALAQYFGEAVWEAPVPDKAFLHGGFAQLSGHVSIQSAWPGIMWSVGVWSRRYGKDVAGWLAMPESRWLASCTAELFYIGKQSALLNKQRLLRYLLAGPKSPTALLADGLLPLVGDWKAWDRAMRKRLVEPYQKDQLPVQMQQALTRRARILFGESYLALPQALMLGLAVEEVLQ